MDMQDLRWISTEAERKDADHARQSRGRNDVVWREGSLYQPPAEDINGDI